MGRLVLPVEAGTSLEASGDGSLHVHRKRVLSQLGSGKSWCSAYTELSTQNWMFLLQQDGYGYG